MIFKLCAMGILAAAVGALFADMGFRARRSFLAAAVVLLLLGTVEGIGKIVEALFGGAAAASELAECAVKIVGTGYVFGISSDRCRELDAGGVATALALAGRIEIIVVVLPYFMKIVSLGTELLK